MNSCVSVELFGRESTGTKRVRIRVLSSLQVIVCHRPLAVADEPREHLRLLKAVAFLDFFNEASGSGRDVDRLF